LVERLRKTCPKQRRKETSKQGVVKTKREKEDDDSRGSEG